MAWKNKRRWGGHVGRWPPVALVSLLILSLLWNAVQLTDRRRSDESLVIGGLLGPIAALDPGGSWVTIRFPPETRTLLYVFSPRCSWCDANLPAIQQLSEHLDDITVIGLSTADSTLPAYLARAKLSFPVYSTTIETMNVRGFTATPTTLLLDASGRIERIWRGAYVGETRSAIEAVFGLTFAGLPEQISEWRSQGTGRFRGARLLAARSAHHREPSRGGPRQWNTKEV